MSTKLIKKHDALSKKFLTNLDSAKIFLKTHLDPKIMVKCNIKTLTIESGSYIDGDLRKRFSDIVYKIDLIDKSSCVYVYILVEHQSSAEKLMPVRILRYQLEIIQSHIDKYKIDNNLPLVIPIVFYNGDDSPYPYATDIFSLFADKEMIGSTGLGKFKLIDLTIMPDGKILKHKQLALLEMVLKHIHERNFNQKITDSIFRAILVAYQNNISKEIFDSVVSYLMNARDSSELLPLFDKIIENVSEYKEDIMTYAEELRQEGIQKGIKKGIQEGIQEGIQLAQRQMVEEMLRVGAELSFIEKVSHLSKKQIEKIKKTMH